MGSGRNPARPRRRRSPARVCQSRADRAAVRHLRKKWFALAARVSAKLLCHRAGFFLMPQRIPATRWPIGGPVTLVERPGDVGRATLLFVGRTAERADTKPSPPAVVRRLSRPFPPFSQWSLFAQLRHSQRNLRCPLNVTCGPSSCTFLCRNTRHHHPRHFRIEPARAVGANDKISRIEDMASDEIQHRAIDLGSVQLH
jgi:hypothetical protein